MTISPSPALAGRILVIRSGALGDFILTLPAIRALREAWPEARLDIIGKPAVVELAHGRYYADAVRSIDRADLIPLFTPDPRPSPELAAYLRGLDLLLSYLPDRDGLFLRNLEKVGVKRIVFGNALPADGEDMHITDQLSEPVEGIGIAVRDRVPRVFLSAEDNQKAEEFLVAEGIRGSDLLFAVHPGSGGARKCWAPDRFAKVADEVGRATGAKVLIPCGPADEQAVAGMVPAMSFAPAVARDLPLPVLGALLARCGAYLGNDSGVTHLAAATGASAVALFGPTDPRVWGPRGENVRVLQGNPSLAGEQRLESISVEQVFQVVREVLGLRRGNRAGPA